MSLSPYISYKESGIEWLGEVPSHWEVARLGSLFQEVTEPGEAGLPILSVSIHDGVSDKELTDDEMDRMVARSDDPTKYRRVKPGDLVYNMMRAWQGGFGTVAVPGMVSPAYVVARPRRKLSTAFVELLLRTPFAVEEMRRLSRGVTDFRLRLYWDEFKGLKVAIPPDSEQSAIAAFLDRETAKIDALVDEQKRLIELLKEKRQAVISHAVTKGLDPNAQMKDSGIEWLGEVPAHWITGSLKRAFQSVDYGISDSLDVEGSVAILRMGNIANGRVTLDNLKFVEHVGPDLLLEPGDLLFNRTNSLDQIGKVGLVEETGDKPLSFASYLVRIRTNSTARPRFLAYMLNTPGLLGEARANALVAIGQCNLNPTRYGEFHIVLPPPEEANEIVTFLDQETGKLDVLTVEAEAAIALLQERRSALISAAVTGKIDVRNLASVEAEAA